MNEPHTLVLHLRELLRGHETVDDVERRFLRGERPKRLLFEAQSAAVIVGFRTGRKGVRIAEELLRGQNIVDERRNQILHVHNGHVLRALAAVSHREIIVAEELRALRNRLVVLKNHSNRRFDRLFQDAANSARVDVNDLGRWRTRRDGLGSGGRAGESWNGKERDGYERRGEVVTHERHSTTVTHERACMLRLMRAPRGAGLW